MVRLASPRFGSRMRFPHRMQSFRHRSVNIRFCGGLTASLSNSKKALRRFANLVMRNHAQTTFSDTEAEIGEAVDFVVHVERQPGRRILREVLAVRGYDRDAKRFLIELIFEVKHATA